MPRIGFLAGLILLAGLCACSEYVADYHYQPIPALADIPATQPQEPPPLSAVASIVGIHREDKSQGIPESVEVGIRLENNGPATIGFDPKTLQLSNGVFVNFPPPLAHPGQTITLAPMQNAIVSAFFPFPPGRSWDDIDINYLQLRWSLQIEARTVRQIVNFQRVFPRYYYYPYYGPYGPYWDYPPVWVGGGVIIHRR